MAFENNGSFDASPIKFGDIDVTFDEKGSTFLAFRKIQWCKNGETPDESLAKLELRKWRVQKDGSERPDKGFSFLTPEGPHELARVLVSQGYGSTRDILSELRIRDDFKYTIEHFNDVEDDKSDGEYFDMRTLMENISEEEDD